MSNSTAGAFWFLLLIQCGERPEQYCESLRFDTKSHEDINVETNRLSNQSRQPIILSLGPSELKEDVFALQVA
jgi:hypothetical protein